MVAVLGRGLLIVSDRLNLGEEFFAVMLDQSPFAFSQLSGASRFVTDFYVIANPSRMLVQGLSPRAISAIHLEGYPVLAWPPAM